MSDNIPLLTKPRLLITVSLPGPEEIELPLLQAFQHIDVILLGCYAVPEQTPPEQAREQFEEEAQEKLQIVADSLSRYDVNIDTHLVFTGRLKEAVQQTIEDEAVDAVLYLRPLFQMKTILVPLHSEQQQPQHIASFLAALVKESKREVHLRLFLGPEKDADAQALLQDQMATFTAVDIASDQLKTEVVETDDPTETIISLAKDYDLLVLGELNEPSLRERLFGAIHEKIIPEVSCPVVLVLYQQDV